MVQIKRRPSIGVVRAAVGQMALLAALTLGCGSASSEDGFDAALTCAGLANRWVDIQQSFLDDLEASHLPRINALAGPVYAIAGVA